MSPNASQVSCWTSVTVGVRPDASRAPPAGEPSSSRTSVGELAVDGPRRQRRERDDADQRALERAEVHGDALGDRVEDLVRGRGKAVERDALEQDRAPGLQVGRQDLGDQPGGEAVAQAVGEAVEVRAAGGRS